MSMLGRPGSDPETRGEGDVDGATPGAVAPALRVLHGNPTAEEIAALVSVLLRARPAVGDAEPRPTPSRWRASALPPTPMRTGRHAWRASALPR